MFARFRPAKRDVDPPEFGIDSFLGTTFRRAYNSSWSSYLPSYPPPIDEEYFEWIDLLTAVVEAKERFTFVELGAGYGRWSIRAAAAARQFGILKVSLACVEAEATHFEWLRQTLIDNDLDPNAHLLRCAAVCGHGGQALFQLSKDRDSLRYAPAVFYGQAVVQAPDSPAILQLRDEIRAAMTRVLRHRVPSRTAVEAVTLDEVLSPFASVDLIDLDVQGAELAIIDSSHNVLNDKVKRLHIGTHSATVERGLRKSLFRLGWTCTADYGCSTTTESPYGVVTFQDGVQSWLNPRLGGWPSPS